jgi:hypothetical protein
MNAAADALQYKHLRFGWLLLGVFSVLGTALELLHAFKLGFYLDVDAEARRLLWRLAHAHGALLGLINVAFALSAPLVPAAGRGRLALSSRCLLVASVLLPLGFFLGGSFAKAADPGISIALVPIGAVLLITGFGAMAQALRR